MEKSVLFVCTGNTCRSPLAEAWFNKRAAECGLTEYVGKSAGLFAMPGGLASENSQMVAAEFGGSLENFRSQPLSYELIREASLIIGMTDGHCRKIAGAVPEAAGKVHRLLEFDEDGEVSDPFGGSLEDYRTCFKSMQKAIDNLILDLKNNNSI